MTRDGTYTAVVDRFEGDSAVLLLEADGETVAEHVLDVERLPEEGRHVDGILEVEIEDDAVVDVTYAPEETAERADRAQRRFDALSERPPSSEDDSSTDSSADSSSDDSAARESSTDESSADDSDST